MLIKEEKSVRHVGMQGFVEACIPMRQFASTVNVPTKYCQHLLTGANNVQMNYVCILDVSNLDGLAKDIALLRDTHLPMIILCDALTAASAGDFFTRQGLPLIATAQGKYCDLTHFSYQPHPDIVVREVMDHPMLNTWRDIAAEGFVYPRDCDALLMDNFFATDARRNALKLFLAYVDGQAVGQAMLILGKDFSVNMWSSVLPAFRNRGVLTELLRYRNNVAKKAGYTRSVVQCLPTSASIYDKNGYHNAEILNLYTLNE